MANQITNGWTSLFNGEATTNIVDTVGSAAGTLDAEIYYTANNSVGQYCTSTRTGLLYNAGATQSAWANSHFKILVNCGIVGLLATIVNGGMTVRFTGPTVTNWFEFRVGGSDSWPTAFSGGWVLFVVDIQATPSLTNGTPPATNACQRVGVTFVTGGTMPRMSDNTWMDNIEYLPDGNSGILIEGRNAGTTPWKWSDVVGTAAIRNAATARSGPAGSVILASPVTFFANDASTHEFSDTNQIILFDDQPFIATDFKKLTQIGTASGTSNLTAGVKTGTGDDATGGQGWVIAASGASWALDVDDTNITSSNWYGCQFTQGGTLNCDGAAVSIISTLLNSVFRVHADGAEFLRNTVVQQAGTDNNGFLWTSDMSDVVFCSFTAFSGSPASLGGHAIQLHTPYTATQTSKGNTFTSYTADNTADAAIYNNQANAVTLNVTEGGTTPTVRNGTSATTSVNSAVTVSLSGVTRGTSIKFIADETVGTVTKGDVLSEGFADINGAYSFSLNYEGAFGAGLDVRVVARNQGVAVAAIAADGGVFTNETDEASSNLTADMTLLPAVPAVSDAYYFAHSGQFLRLKLDISTALAQSSPPTLVWEYWNGAWVSLSGVVDGTNALQTAGENIVSWNTPSGWSTTTVNAQGPLYYVRVRLSAVGTITTVPVGRKVTLDTARYLPYSANRIITSSGLSDTATWTEDTIAKFSQT